MNHPAAGKEQARQQQLPSCPCCQFLPDLFLPSSLSDTVAAGGANAGTADQVDSEDTQSSVPLSPSEAWEYLKLSSRSDGGDKETSSSSIMLVDTHGHAHLERPGESEAEVYGSGSEQSGDERSATECQIASLTCAVAPEDWEACLEYASQSRHRVAAIGLHPWYLDNLSETWYEDLEALIAEHPGCMVGETGLCKQARFVRTYEEGKKAALELQRSVFAKQLQLAAKYGRGVSIHCVNQQGVMFDVLKQLEETKQLPPVMAMHSFTGTAHHVQQLLKWEESLTGNSKSSQQQPMLYFGFSHIVNYAMCSSEKARRQGRLAIRAVKRDRLLAESDVHSDADVARGTAGSVAYIAWALGESLESVAELTKRNGLRFLGRAHV